MLFVDKVTQASHRCEVKHTFLPVAVKFSPIHPLNALQKTVQWKVGYEARLPGCESLVLH